MRMVGVAVNLKFRVVVLGFFSGRKKKNDDMDAMQRRAKIPTFYKNDERRSR